MFKVHSLCCTWYVRTGFLWLLRHIAFCARLLIHSLVEKQKWWLKFFLTCRIFYASSPPNAEVLVEKTDTFQNILVLMSSPISLSLGWWGEGLVWLTLESVCENGSCCVLKVVARIENLRVHNSHVLREKKKTRWKVNVNWSDLHWWRVNFAEMLLIGVSMITRTLRACSGLATEEWDMDMGRFSSGSWQLSGCRRSDSCAIRCRRWDRSTDRTRSFRVDFSQAV